MAAFGALTLGACSGQKASADAKSAADLAKAQADIAMLTSEVRQLKEWLGTSPSPVARPENTVHEWHKNVFKAICNLEFKASPPAADRLCAGTDPEHGGPPQPPPWGT
jgi:hypothetical protein